MGNEPAAVPVLTAQPETPRRVLVIEDAALMRLFYRKTLEEAGFIVDEALNGIEGMEKVLSQGFDLLIVDINMPKMDGCTFLRNLRREPAVAATPALVATSEAGEHDIDAARAAGANYYLVKPIAPGDLALYAAVLTGRPA